MTISTKYVRRSAAVLATHGSQLRASDIRVMPLLHDEFQKLGGLADISLADTAFTASLTNYTNLTDFEMEDFEEGPYYMSECPLYEAMALSSWTTLESGEIRLFAKLPDVDHDKRQAWIDDDRTNLHVRAERVVPAQGARCLPEDAQLTVDGSHEVFEAASLLPLGFDFTRIVLQETDAGLEFICPADESDDAAPDDVEAASADCPHYEHMEVTDWKLLPSGEFELEANLPEVAPAHSKVQLSEDGTALHVHAWRAITVQDECFPEGTQTAISDDGQYEIFERAVLLPSQVDATRLSIVETRQGFRVTAPTLVIEDQKVMESIAANQSEEEDISAQELDWGEENGLDHQAILADFDFSLPDLCPSYHPLQISPWRMTLAGFPIGCSFSWS
jgi:hypothetical protein